MSSPDVGGGLMGGARGSRKATRLRVTLAQLPQVSDGVSPCDSDERRLQSGSRPEDVGRCTDWPPSTDPHRRVKDGRKMTHSREYCHDEKKAHLLSVLKQFKSDLNCTEKTQQIQPNYILVLPVFHSSRIVEIHKKIKTKLTTLCVCFLPINNFEYFWVNCLPKWSRTLGLSDC